jgi:hypothetical protein
MISDADRSTKDSLGRAAYVVTGVRNLGARRVKATVEVDGTPFYKGKVSCVLAANVGKILGGIEAFPEARPDDGRLELGVVTAGNPVQWARTLARLACRRWWFWSRSHPNRVAGAVSRLWSPAFRRSRPRGMRPGRSNAFSFGLMSIVVAVSQSAANSRLPRISVG